MTPGFDVVVVGAGAAGLMAAARASELGGRVLLLEKNRKPGVKILMSGGTRCNITHATDRRGIVEAFGRQGKFLHSALAALSPQDVVGLIEAEGVATKVEETGKIFPVSNKAADVLGALLSRVRASGAVLALEVPLVELRRVTDGFALITGSAPRRRPPSSSSSAVDKGEDDEDEDAYERKGADHPGRVITARSVIVTTGGQSYPGCGTTGDGYHWAAALGHSVVPPRPALVPITTNAAWVLALKGVTIPDVGVRVLEASETAPGAPTVLAERRGGFLFTHFGLSGPAALDVSRAISGHPRPQSLLLECDFLPAMSAGALGEFLQQQSMSAGKKQVGGTLPADLPRRLGDTLLELAGVPPDRKAAEISKAERSRLVQAIKRQAIPVAGTRGFGKAEVTAGGIDLEEIDSRTMQSKLVPGFYLAGEVLDLDGPIGGYNFQAAFSTGWLAGQSVATQFGDFFAAKGVD